ncbi:TPA: MFS transporter [Klebsiella pneumoniae]|nr:MFS transporter [Klebsiella pneumoniae]
MNINFNHSNNDSQSAMRFVLLIGILSFFADFTHEGARSILGSYLASLQASAFAVGAVSGFGELMGYSLRFFSGRIAESIGKFWPITITGYAVQMTAVPALALTDNWHSAAVLIILERTGRAIRIPTRDAMLSHAANNIGGYGWTFGIHEACDQLGALSGPLVMSWVLMKGGDFHRAFAVLLIPACINIILVLTARYFYPSPEKFESDQKNVTSPKRLPDTFWMYLTGACFVAVGFADYPLLAYHFTRDNILSVNSIPILYATAMGFSGSSSLLFGRLFDRFGFRLLIVLTAITAMFSPLIFFGGITGGIAGALLWGIGTGVHESIIPAAVSPMVSATRRASAFGLFTGAYGAFWFAGSAIMGLLYDYSVLYMVIFCVVSQMMALPFFFWVCKRKEFIN